VFWPYNTSVIGGSGRILGFPADAFFRVSLTLADLALGASAAAFYASGRHQTAAVLGLSSGILGMGLALGRILEEEQDRAARNRSGA
jgi:hypothetical protein